MSSSAIILYSVTLKKILKVNILNCNISETVRASVKMRAMTIIDADIRHRMASLQTLYSVKLISIVQG